MQWIITPPRVCTAEEAEAAARRQAPPMISRVAGMSQGGDTTSGSCFPGKATAVRVGATPAPPPPPPQKGWGPPVTVSWGGAV